MENNIGNSNNTFEFIVKQLGEPILVPPAEETQRGPFFLTNFDQLYFKVYTGTTYFYKSRIDDEKVTVVEEVIKEALSRVLVHYYPVAGRLRFSAESQGKLELNCNGEGAMFVVAETDCVIDDIIQHAKLIDPLIVHKLIYKVSISENMLDVPLLVAQVTKFKCGGFVLGLCTNHSLFDGIGAMDFINSWSEIARDLPMKDPPLLDRTVLKSRNPPRIEFPHHEFQETEDVSKITDLYEKEEVIYKSFSFSVEKLEILKKKAMEDGVLAKCTTFEALSAFIWRARTQALKLQPNQQIRIRLSVNGRTRLDPPLPERYIGNCVVHGNSPCSVDKLLKNSYSFAVGLVQEAIKMVTNDYIRSVRDYVEMTRPKNSRSPIDLKIVSWTQLSFHKTDFGWGKPVYASRASLPMKEGAYFLSDMKENERNGIMVLLGLPASSMKIFQQLLLAQLE